MPVSIPYTFIGGVGNKAKASEVNANFTRLASKFTEGAGGIKDVDVSTGADLNANKLSDTDGKRITATKFQPGAVDATALRSDAVTDANRAVTTDHLRDFSVIAAKLRQTAGSEAVVTQAIRDLAVTKGKLATAGGSKATYAQLEMLVETTAADFTININNATASYDHDSWVLNHFLTTSGGNWVVSLTGEATRSSGGVTESTTITVSPTTARPTASWHVWYVLKDVTLTWDDAPVPISVDIKGRVIFFSIALS